MEGGVGRGEHSPGAAKEDRRQYTPEQHLFGATAPPPPSPVAVAATVAATAAATAAGITVGIVVVGAAMTGNTETSTGVRVGGSNAQSAGGSSDSSRELSSPACSAVVGWKPSVQPAGLHAGRCWRRRDAPCVGTQAGCCGRHARQNSRAYPFCKRKGRLWKGTGKSFLRTGRTRRSAGSQTSCPEQQPNGRQNA